MRINNLVRTAFFICCYRFSQLNVQCHKFYGITDIGFMSVKLTKKLFIMLYSLLMLLAGLSIGPFMAFSMPEHYFRWYPLIPVFFFLLGWVCICMLGYASKLSPHKVRLYYLYSKLLKIVASILFLSTYVILVNSHRTEFFIVFLLFYVICLLFESWFVSRYEEQQLREAIKQFYNLNK